MGKLATKHPNQRTVSYRDFSGGLNTTDATESIATNELGRAVNVCLDKSTGLLRTIAGTDCVCRTEQITFDYCMYDSATGWFILTDIAGNIYSLQSYGENFELGPDGNYMPVKNKIYRDRFENDNGDLMPAEEPTASRYFGESEDEIFPYDEDDNSSISGNALQAIGQLTGTGPVQFAEWEDGLVISSGGKLQYFYSGTVETISESPEVCNGVFVREGRIWTWFSDELHMSDVGNEHGWETDSERSDSAQWVQIGYKDRGNIKGVAALSSDVIIIKDNGHAYHLSGQFPDWSVKSISRQLGVKNYECCLAVGNSVVVLGDGRLQLVETTEDYGEMKAQYISRKVENEIRQLGPNIRLRYVPTENEIWFIDSNTNNRAVEFLTYDVSHGSFFMRRYLAPVRDVLSAGEDTYILKTHSFAKTSSDMKMEDEGECLEWEFRTVTLVGYNQFLLKRVYVDITPLFDDFHDQRFKFGDICIPGGLPPTARFIYHNRGVVPHGRRYVCDPWLGLLLTDTADSVYHNDEYIYKKEIYLRSIKCYRTEARCADRRVSVPVRARGIGGVTLFNQIAFDVAEI